MSPGSFYALLAGLLGAAGSLSAKLSLGSDHLRQVCESLSSWTGTHGGASACDQLSVPLRLLCGGLLLTCNAVMWNFFSKALRHSSSSAKASVTSTASNFICSGVLGRLFFGESHAALWWAGISLTLCGLVLLRGSTLQTLSQDQKHK